MATWPQEVQTNPKMLGKLTKALRDANAQIEKEIAGATDFGVANRRAIQRKIDKILQEVGEQGLKDIERAIPQMYKEGSTGAIRQLKQIKAGYVVGADFTVIDKRAVAALLSDTQRAFAEAVTQVGRSAGRVLSKATKEAIKAQLAQDQVLGRTLVKRTAMIKGILKEQGITALKDGRGVEWSLDRYGEMLVRTKMVEARNTGLANKMMQNGYDLVQVTSTRSRHFECAYWEGRVLSLTGGSKTYPSVADAEAAGLFHPNCQHAINAIPTNIAYDADIYDPETGQYVSAKKEIKQLGKNTQWVKIGTRFANEGNWRELNKLLKKIPKNSKAYKDLSQLFGGEIKAAKRIIGIKPQFDDAGDIVLKHANDTATLQLTDFEKDFIQSSDLRVATGRGSYRFDQNTLGVYVPSRHALYIRDVGSKGVKRVFYHELGHSIDHRKIKLGRLIDRPEFTKAYDADMVAVLSARLQWGGMAKAQADAYAAGKAYRSLRLPRSYYRYATSKSEIFADAYAQYRENPAKFAKYAPRLNTYFKEVLK